MHRKYDVSIVADTPICIVSSLTDAKIPAWSNYEVIRMHLYYVRRAGGGANKRSFILNCGARTSWLQTCFTTRRLFLEAINNLLIMVSKARRGFDKDKKRRRVAANCISEKRVCLIDRYETPTFYENGARSASRPTTISVMIEAKGFYSFSRSIF